LYPDVAAFQSFKKFENDAIIFPTEKYTTQKYDNNDRLIFHSVQNTHDSSSYDKFNRFPIESGEQKSPDLRPSLTLQKESNLNPFNIVNQPTHFPDVVYTLNATCTSNPTLRVLLTINNAAESGVYKFPNGTEITYAKCIVVHIKHPKK
jgi:hypothetical protein